jgi:hypothetical protein
MPVMTSFVDLDDFGPITVGGDDRDVSLARIVPRGSGRPSLGVPGTVSPKVSFRVRVAVRDQAARFAKRQHKSLSRFAREALEERVRQCVLEEAAQFDALCEKLRQRGPGILDRPIEEYEEDVEGW